MQDRLWLRLGLMVVYGFIGIVHLTATRQFLPIMPAWVPAPYAVVIATGLCEIAGVIGLMWQPTRRWAGLLLALYAICVFPANIKHAVEGIHIEGLPDSWWYHGPRLALQPIFVWWALYATLWIDWPFDRKPPVDAGRT